MNDLNITTIGQVQQFLAGTKGVVFEVHSKVERYQWLQSTFNKFGYHHRLCKSHKGILRSYMRKVTEYSEQQLTRLISKHSKTGRLVCKSYVRHKFAVHYTKNDILLLAHVDKLHDILSEFFGVTFSVSGVLISGFNQFLQKLPQSSLESAKNMCNFVLLCQKIGCNERIRRFALITSLLIKLFFVNISLLKRKTLSFLYQGVLWIKNNVLGNISNVLLPERLIILIFLNHCHLIQLCK